jgi:hypothetical protein
MKVKYFSKVLMKEGHLTYYHRTAVTLSLFHVGWYYATWICQRKKHKFYVGLFSLWVWNLLADAVSKFGM